MPSESGSPEVIFDLIVWCGSRFAAMHKRIMKTVASFLLGFAALLCVSFVAAAAPDPCKDCDAVTGLTVRERIKADRAREADRVAEESHGTSLGW